MGDHNDHGMASLSQEQRRQLAVDLFNHVWTLLELAKRTRSPATRANPSGTSSSRAAGKEIADDEDRDHLLSELATLAVHRSGPD